jgi:hypothetical protein
MNACACALSRYASLFFCELSFLAWLAVITMIDEVKLGILREINKCEYSRKLNGLTGKQGNKVTSG